MQRFLAVLEYDGTAFHGSQVQGRGRTVQGELESALARLDGRPVRAILAGRTDRGVHASGQVAAFDLRRTMSGQEVANALCALLPGDVSVREAAPAPDGFHPRFWAEARRYRYRILQRPRRSAIWERFSHQVPYRLDVSGMRAAARNLVGRHDFRCFGRAPQGNHTVRTVTRLELECCGEHLAIVVEADAFLRRMVRRLVGTLLNVGRGRTSVEQAGLLVDGGPECAGIGPAVPAKGLTFEGVAYDRGRLGLGTGCWWSCDPLVPAH